MRGRRFWLLGFSGVLGCAREQGPRPEDTEIWEPVPPVAVSSVATDTVAPADAIVLFDGSGLDEWVNTRDGGPAAWTLLDGLMVVDKSVGNIETRRRFGNYELHLEYRIPEGITGDGQARGNSGLFLASTGEGDRGYELQILDSYGNATYVNGMAGSVYKQSPPLVNASRAPGEWQSYDVIFHAPRFDAAGAKIVGARFERVLHNGVLIHENFECTGPTRGSWTAVDVPRGPLRLQGDHGPVAYRNIRIRPLD
jgi:hypothetical protein